MKLKLNNNTQKSIMYLIAIILGFLAISSVSFWIDEGIRLKTSYLGTFNDALQVGISGKTLLMYIIQYGWTKIFGQGEFIARCLNIPFYIVTVYYFSKIINKLDKNVFFTLILVINPVTFYYLNDAGPYIMLLSCTSAFCYYVFFTNDFGTIKNTLIINFIFLIGVGIHFIFGFVYIIYFVKILILLIKKENKIKNHIISFLSFIPFYAVLLYFYANGLQNGSDAYGWSRPSIKNFIYPAYAFLGFQGTFLSRNDLRALNFHNIKLWMAILTLILLLSWFVIIILNFKSFIKIIKKYKIMTISFVTYYILFSIVSYFSYFQLWERHVIPLLLFISIIIVELLNDIFKRKDNSIKSYIFKSFSVILIIVLSISCYNIRFTHYYQKDDFKGMTSYVSSIYDDDTVIITNSFDGTSNLYYFYSAGVIKDSYPQAPKDKNKKGNDVPVVYYHAEQNAESILKAINYYKNSGYKVVLVLAEKNTPSDFYLNATSQLSNDNVKTEYNTFKVFNF